MTVHSKHQTHVVNDTKEPYQYQMIVLYGDNIDTN